MNLSNGYVGLLYHMLQILGLGVTWYKYVETKKIFGFFGKVSLNMYRRCPWIQVFIIGFLMCRKPNVLVKISTDFLHFKRSHLQTTIFLPESCSDITTIHHFLPLSYSWFCTSFICKNYCTQQPGLWPMLSLFLVDGNSPLKGDSL